MPLTSDQELAAVLSLERIAVVGCSTTPGKPAHDVPKYLRAQGYDIVPVNPFADRIFGRQAYDSLTEIDDAVDVVCVFRPSDELAEIVGATLERADEPVIWTQLGIGDETAIAMAEDAGHDVVADRCMKIEHQRLVD